MGRTAAPRVRTRQHARRGTYRRRGDDRTGGTEAGPVYAYYPNGCVNRTVNTYLLNGTLPARDTVCDA
ncbi:alpha/beta hydrolase [Streptomyces sp. NPDC060054]|uniref:alpha/beta hydrolase n=1 Tax=unclassified Streptomyces TaxID=2593676 RepID=UPI0009A111AC